MALNPQFRMALVALCLAAGSARSQNSAARPADVPPLLALDAVTGPENAPITVVVFADFESFLCARSAAVLTRILSENPDVRVVFKHAPDARHARALLAHEAVLAAGAQGKFWEMHDAVFANQPRMSRTDLLGYAKTLRLNVPVFQRALDSHVYRPIVERELIEAGGLGITTTPTFFVNGRRLVGPQAPETLAGVIGSVRDSLSKSQDLSQTVLDAGLSLAIRLEHSPAKGPVAAPVSFVEFAAFDCPYCARTVATIRQLLTAYPDQLRFSFKHYPLEMQDQALLPHEAAAAAGDQGKFWEMHDLIFATRDRLSRDDLIAKARKLNLDVARFTKDLDAHRFRPLIESDRNEGSRLGVNATPFFFINGHAVSGSASLADLKRFIDAARKDFASNSGK